MQRTIAAFNTDNESKITVSEVSGLGGSTNASKFNKHFRNLGADENEFELPALKRKGSRH